MALTFSDASEKKIQKALSRYPTLQAALLPVLWIAQEQFGWIPGEAMELVANRLDLSPAHVYGVVTFYTMFHTSPVGKYHLQVCRTLPCALLGCEKILSFIKERLGVQEGQTPPDKKFTLTTAECIASCGTAPVIMINDDFYENVSKEKADELIKKYSKT